MINDTYYIRIVCRFGSTVEKHEFNRATMTEKGNFIKVYHEDGKREAWFAKNVVVRVHIRPPKTVEDLVTD